MVQEVQTGIWITNETTLETIEAIGTSSFKIREWRQTVGGHYVSRCIASWNVYREWHTWDNRDSGVLTSPDIAITEDYWTSGFSIRDGGVRVPVAWSYQIDIYWNGGAGTLDATFILKWGGKVLYSKSSWWTNYTDNTTIMVELWKFDLIEICWEFYYTDSSSLSAFFWGKPTLTITQL